MEELELNYEERVLVERKLKPTSLEQLIVNSCRLSTDKRDEEVATQVMMKVGKLLTPSPVDSLSLYKAATRPNPTVSTGVKELDEALGGLRTGEITELVGISGSGKTWLCHMICSEIIGSQTALYVDCSNSFTAHTLHSCFMRRNRAVPMSIVHRLKVAKYFDDPEGLLTALEQVAAAPRSVTEDEPFLANLRVIVVDSVASLFSQSLSKRPYGHRILSMVARALKRIAVEHDVAVVTTNWVSGTNEKGYQPALGEFWRSMVSTRISLKSTEYGKIEAYLHLHPVRGPGPLVCFEM